MCAKLEMSIVIILRYGRVLWQLLRPKTAALLILQTLLVWMIVCGELPSWWQLTVIVVLISCWYMHAVAVNDLSDYEVDMINLTHRDDASDRPLVNQSSDSKSLWMILHFLEIILIGLWAAIDMRSVWCAVVLLFLNYAYSMRPFRISARGVLALLLLPVGYVLYPAGLVYMLGESHMTVEIMISIAGLFMLFMGRLFLKDFRDEKGDRATGKRTFLVRHGPKVTLIISGGLMAIGVAAMWFASRHFQIGLGLIASFVIGGAWWCLWRCCYEHALADRLVYIALAGRLMSWWVFMLLLAGLLSIYHVPMVQSVYLLAVAAAMFAIALWWLFSSKHDKTCIAPESHIEKNESHNSSN